MTTELLVDDPPLSVGALDRMRFRLASGLDVGVAAYFVIGAAGYVVLLALHGFLPGQSQPTVQAHLASGVTECLRGLGVEALWQSCPRVGYPAGEPLLSGIIEQYLSTGVAHLPRVDSWTAHVVVDAACLLAGYIAFVTLLRRWGAARWAALGASFGFLSSMSIVWINGFAATFNGFVLLPVYVLLLVMAIARFERGSLLVPSALMLSAALLAVFTDGYSFVEGGLLGAVLVAFWAWRHKDVDRRLRLIGIGAFVGSTIVAAMAYVVYVPSGAYETQAPMGTFRAFGADLATILVPQKFLWWTEFFDIRVFFGDGWGDYSAYSSNYLGYVLVGLAIWALVRRIQSKQVVPLLIAGAIAVVLALGPSLKVWDFRTTPEALSYVATDMPHTQAHVGLPTTLLFDNVPGLSDMRATYRWIFITVFCLFSCAALTVTAIHRKGKRALAIGLAAVALLEVLPNIDTYSDQKYAFAAQLREFRSGPGREIAEILSSNDIALFLPAGNDWAVNSMIPFTKAKSFNVGIDKNVTYSQARWPEAIRLVVGSFGSPDEINAVFEALRTKTATVIVFPRFDLQYGAQAWPYAERDPGAAEQQAALFEESELFRVDRYQWFVTIRLPDDPSSG